MDTKQKGKGVKEKIVICAVNGIPVGTVDSAVDMSYFSCFGIFPFF
jgi:hypothetical protein